MTYSLTWLPHVLMDAGLKVAEVDGWASRGRAEMGTVAGVICHHTAGPLTGNMPSLRTLIDGRADLPGPLSQLGLGRDGAFYVIAAGRCNHAGAGRWQGITSGNSSFIGIEAENAGTENDPWPEIQLMAYQQGVAAILRYLGKTADACAGHREYATPSGRKTDPNFDMMTFRAKVAALLGQNLPPLALIPKDTAALPNLELRPTLRRNASGDAVRALQGLLDLPIDGLFGAQTEARVRIEQTRLGLVPDGIVGPKTWLALSKLT